MMNSLKLASVNIHGLRNSTKRKTFFRYLKKGAFDIICIQESYITDADKEMWEREWGGSLFYTSVTGHSMGKIILVRKNFPFDVQCVFENDRILTVRVVLSNNEMYVTNV